MSLLTIKVKTKRRPWWSYAVAAIVSLPLSACWAWAAYSGIGFSPALARRVFVVFTVLQLLFCPLLYLANERQVRNHSSKSLVVTATAFSASFAAAVLYFIATHEKEIIFPVVYGSITIGLSIRLLLFGIRWEFE